MKKMHNSPIWIVDEENPNIISKNFLQITDEEVYQQIIKDLKDYSAYSSMGYFSLNESHKTNISTNFTGYYKTERNNDRTIYNLYYNPREEVLKILTGLSYNQDLQLIRLFHLGTTTEEKIQQLHIAKEILMQVEKSQLEKNSIRSLIENTWPNFGFFAINGLKCTSIEPIASYDLNDIKQIKRLSEKAKIDVNPTITEILIREDTAITNGKVLTLAKQAEKITR